MNASPESSRRLRHRAQLIEFLKFRVLASQEAFFAAWQPAVPESADPIAGLDVAGFRQWLQPLWPAASQLDDADLLDCLARAHALYVDAGPQRSR